MNNRDLLRRPGWHGTHRLLASASQVLGIQVCITKFDYNSVLRNIIDGVSAQQGESLLWYLRPSNRSVLVTNKKQKNKQGPQPRPYF